MNIEFPGPAISADDGGISYRAKVDGQTVSCHFTKEVLEDVNPALSDAESIEQFSTSKGHLLCIAEKKIRTGHVVSGVVRIFTVDI